MSHITWPAEVNGRARAAAVNRARRRAGLTQAEIAAEAGVTQGLVSRVLRGQAVSAPVLAAAERLLRRRRRAS